MTSHKSYIAGIIMLLLPLTLAAQDKWVKPAGGIENAQVVIEKDKIISLRPVSRRFRAIAVEVPEAKPINITFKLAEPVDTLPSLQVIVRPKTMKDQPLDKFYGLTAKLGYGNYNSPYALLDFGTKRSDEYMLNAYFNHYSSAKGPVEDDFSGDWNTRLGVAGKYFINNIVGSAELDYTNHSYRFYGYDPAEIINPAFNRDTLKQKLNTISINLGLADNNLKNNIDYDVQLGFNYLSNNHDVSELYYGLASQLDVSLTDNLFLDTRLVYAGFSQNGLNITDLNRRFVQVEPVLGYKMGDFTFKAGVNFFHQNDPLTLANNESTVNIYPVAGVDYQLTPNHQVSLGIYGAVEKLSLNQLYDENPYLNPAAEVSNNLNNFAADASLQGQLVTNLGYKLTYAYKHYNRQLFYTNNAADTAMFNLVYDEQGSSLNKMAAELTYFVSNKINFSGAVAYNIYSTTGVAEAWHKPTLTTDFTANIQVAERLYTHLTYFLLSGMKAENAAGEVLTLDTVHDLNIGLNLLITERAGIFVDLMNIIGTNYQLYNNYPVKGFQVIAGFSYKF